MATNALNLLNATSTGTQFRVAVPFVKVKIGQYLLGVYSKADLTGSRIDSNGVYRLMGVQYPNFIQDLEVKKINGQINQYTLQLTYQINEDDDPNLIEKILGSISKGREIEFTYGDMSAPTFIYKAETAIIKRVKHKVSVKTASISYTIYAVSNSILANVGFFTFPEGTFKPSTKIRELLMTKKYGLQNIFTGMRSMDLVTKLGLIPTDDKAVKVDRQVNISVLEYLSILVQSMRPAYSNGLYTITVVDQPIGSSTAGLPDITGVYFKITKIDKTNNEDAMAYNIDIGIPGNTVVLDFSIDNDETYSIFYDYSQQLSTNEFVERINDQGEIEEVYAPIVNASRETFKTDPAVASWWRAVTEYPIKGSITIRGLLIPAMLMSKVRIKLYYFGRLHIDSGLYTVTSQVDKINKDGYTTTLGLLRIGGDNSI